MVFRTTVPRTSAPRRYPIGVEVFHHPDGSTPAHARVWAPDSQLVELVTESGSAAVELESEGNGYHSGFAEGLAAGVRYRFRLDRGDCYPDPASRYQPEGPHGPSMAIDPSQFAWTDRNWPGVTIEGQVMYEIHIGTFTTAGTFLGAIDRLPDLVDTGITLIEIMPLADFPGRFGWGYDGVNLFAPCRLYGTPDDLRALVDAAHRLELGVIIDVVYNHFGPDGNYLNAFSPNYLGKQASEWGDSPNFDGPDSSHVRELVVTNARYWIDEFHFDGLRLDATQQIFDRSDPHILVEIADAVRAAGGERGTIVVAENEPQESRIVRSRACGGFGLDAMWNDDFHHASRVAATGRNEAYYSGYRGTPQELVSAAKYGFLYQGQWFRWQGKHRGAPALDLPPTRFITFTQNHDQIANTATGRRLDRETSPGRYRALTALLLLLPQTPLLFQGQEFGASTPFYYFADHRAELAADVRAGRTTFVSQFPSIAANELSARVVDPTDEQTFIRSKLDWTERRDHVAMLTFHRDLIRLRREDVVVRAQRPRGLDGAVIDAAAFVVRLFGEDGDDRLLVVNLGHRLHVDPIAEPLMASPTGVGWQTIFSTESQIYGGWGTPPIEAGDDGWWIPAESAAFLAPRQ
ncbi:MAG TPA: malto-oligosyltrehalose trehalohydrolase [Gemmatimonadaceae bacterium]